MDRYDWVQIVEPLSRDFIYINLETGECLWDPPKDSGFKKSNENEWWELYDDASSRFYYYNTRQQKTVWHRPQGCAIIPLAKLQTLKRRRLSQTSDHSGQSTDKKEISTQTFDTHSPETQRRSHGDDVNNDVTYDDRPSHNDDKLQTSSTRTKSSSSSSSSSSSRAVSASSSEDLFDEPATEQKSCASTADIEVDRRSASDGCRGAPSTGDVTSSSQPANTSHRPLSSSHPVAHHSGTGSSAAHVSTFQITPTLRQRAFPRTNPAYVGTYRRDRPPTYRRIDLQSTSLGVASELRSTASPAVLNNGTKRPNSDGVQRALVQHTGDVVYLSNTAAGRVHGSSGHQCTTVVTHDRTFSTSAVTSSGMLRPQSDGDAAGHSERCVDVLMTAAGGVVRRQSEPDYVNILTRQHHQHHQQLQQQQHVPAAPRPYYTDDSQCEWTSQLVPSAIYMNQHELTIAGRYTSRSTCNFMDPTANGHPEFDFDDSDRSSVYSTPSPQTRQFQTLAPSSVAMTTAAAAAAGGGVGNSVYRQPLGLAAYHPSLRKKRWYDRQGSVGIMTGRQHTLDKSWSLQADRPLSLLAPYSAESSIIANKVADTLLQQMHIEQFVVENLNEHRKGILGKTMPVSHMLSWTKDVIQKPMIRTSSKVVKKLAPEVFRLIQAYMGDRKTRDSALEIALDVAVRGWSVVDLRDEIYIQLCRQTTKNPHEQSAALGWELIGICLAFFPPSSKFYSYLDGHIHKNIDCFSHVSKSVIYEYCTSCQKRLQWIVQVGAKRGLRKPNTDEVRQAKRSLVEPSMFGNTLTEIMLMQRDRYPERRLPWIQTALSEEVLRLNGRQTEGIFRVPGDIDEVNALKVHCDAWHIPPRPHRAADDLETSLTPSPDPHVPASLLKLWYRELSEPIVPFSFYERCIQAFASADEACATVHLLPEINRLALIYLIHFLQGFTRPEVVRVTKMDVNNVAMVWAPNCLRGQSNDPKIIFENTRREMGFVRTLILNLNTNEAVDLV